MHYLRLVWALVSFSLGFGPGSNLLPAFGVEALGAADYYVKSLPGLPSNIVLPTMHAGYVALCCALLSTFLSSDILI